MEVGAVKQAFNNEIILLKKKFSQARIQTIHKLTRKAKTLAEKKCSDQLKEKFKRKAESAVQEVLIMKKLKAKDIAKFSITHAGELKDYINRPKVDEDKACARLLLHKALHDKYEFLRSRFANIPIKDLFMSRQERRALKKEEKQNKKNKRKSNVFTTENNWSIQNINETNDFTNSHTKDLSSDSENDVILSDNENIPSKDENVSNDDGSNDSHSEEGFEFNSDLRNVHMNKVKGVSDIQLKYDNEVPNLQFDEDSINDVGKFVKLGHDNDEHNLSNNEKKKKQNSEIFSKKEKNNNKSKNLSKKILNRKFNQTKSEEHSVVENKVVDPFFITASGENYVSVVEPRQPDEFKEFHRQGNRKVRRAAMFGRTPKKKPRQENFTSDNNFDRNYGFQKSRQIEIRNKDSVSNKNRMSSNMMIKDIGLITKETTSEKLHPSWEAKKRHSAILPFKGKKTVFNED